MSFDHIWVDYPGHQATALENPGVQIAVREHGHFVFHWPRDFHLGAEVNAQVADYWTPMPLGRQVLLFGGLLAIVFVNAIVGWARRADAAGRRLIARRRRLSQGPSGGGIS